MKSERLTYLYQQSLTGTATEQDKKDWLDALSDPANQAFIQQMMAQTWEQVKEETKQDMPADRSHIIFQTITSEAQTGQTSTPTNTERTTQPLWKYTAAIAAAIALIIAGIYFFNYNSINNKTGQQQAQTETDIAPGKQGATLTLANGKKIKLSDATPGQLADEAGVIINKTADGQITYQIKASDNTASNKTNTLSTARGETYKVILPDGSAVWLNAASTLTYPATFAGKEQRRVNLTGEAYFEIAKDKSHPFIVTSDNQDVEVLGTHFNINNYPNSKDIKTTLLEGSVRLYFYPNDRTAEIEKILKPNQQSTIKNNQISIATVDTDDVIAWKNGFLVFEEETLENVMDKVGRWYDLDIEYENSNLKNEIFGGSVSRTENVSQVLRILTKAGTVKFKLTGRKIIVSK